MSRFKSCAKVAYAKLRTYFPQITLGQTQQLLASALGHKTYASYLQSDASVFDGRAAFAVLAPEAAIFRAREFGFEMDQDHWSLLIDEINEKQVVGELELIENLDLIYCSVRFAFYQVQDPRIDELVSEYGGTEVFRQILREALDIRKAVVDSEGQPPVRLCATINGEICADVPRHTGVAVPVLADFGIERIGRRLYNKPVLIAIRRNGAPRQCYPHEELMDGGGDTYGP